MINLKKKKRLFSYPCRLAFLKTGCYRNDCGIPQCPFFPARQVRPVCIRKTSCKIIKDMTDQKYAEMSKQLN